MKPPPSLTPETPADDDTVKHEEIKEVIAESTVTAEDQKVSPVPAPRKMANMNGRSSFKTTDLNDQSSPEEETKTVDNDAVKVEAPTIAVTASLKGRPMPSGTRRRMAPIRRTPARARPPVTQETPGDKPVEKSEAIPRRRIPMPRRGRQLVKSAYRDEPENIKAHE